MIAAITLIIVVSLAYASYAKDSKFTENTSEQGTDSKATVSLPTQTESKIIVVPFLKIELQEIAIARNGLDVPFPWEKSEFFPWSFIQANLNFPLQQAVSGYGDGTVFFVWDDHDPNFYLTPDKGKNWYLIPMPQGITPGHAYLEGDTIVLLVTREVEPWLFQYSEVRIRLNDLQGSHP